VFESLGQFSLEWNGFPTKTITWYLPTLHTIVTNIHQQSLPQTRLHFKTILSGFTTADRTSLTDWPTDTSPHDPSRYFHSHLAAAGLEEPLGGEGRRKCSSSASTGKGKERESGRGSLGGEASGSGRKSLGRESPRGSLGGGGGGAEGSGRKKRRSGAGV
jgi:hypothetical protein